MIIRCIKYSMPLLFFSAQVSAQDNPPPDPRTECYHQCNWEYINCYGIGGYAGMEACMLTLDNCDANCDAIGYNALPKMIYSVDPKQVKSLVA